MLESNKPMHTRASIRFLMRASYQLRKIFHPTLFLKSIYFSLFSAEIVTDIWKTNNTTSV